MACPPLVMTHHAAHATHNWRRSHLAGAPTGPCASSLASPIACHTVLAPASFSTDLRMAWRTLVLRRRCRLSFTHPATSQQTCSPFLRTERLVSAENCLSATAELSQGKLSKALCNCDGGTCHCWRTASLITGSVAEPAEIHAIAQLGFY